MQGETAFKKRVFAQLQSIPNLWYFKMVAVSIVGIPDVIGCRNGRFFALELKVGKNQPSQIQNYVLNAIRKSGGTALVVWPENLCEAMVLLEQLL